LVLISVITASLLPAGTARARPGECARRAPELAS
jgi:hypothetical protein